MPTYTAYFRTDADFATHEFGADTPERALQMARAFFETNAEDLMFEEYGGGMPVNEIAVHEDNREVAIWYDDDLRLRLAAADLLEALQYCEMTLADLEASKRKGYIAHAKKLARAAIAKAKGE